MSDGKRLGAFVRAAIPAIGRGDEQSAVRRLFCIADEIGEVPRFGQADRIVDADLADTIVA